MKAYRRRAVTIHAVQVESWWFDHNLAQQSGIAKEHGLYGVSFNNRLKQLQIATPSELLTARVGDWIVRDERRLTVLSADAFPRLHEPCDEAEGTGT